MSATLFADDIEFLQRMLCAAACFTGPITGTFDADTDAAEQAFFTKLDEIATEVGRVDPRSERCIATLHPKAQRLAREFLLKLKANGIDARIISGTRTYAEQELLYCKGRTAPGNIVTYAKGGHSNHNFGIAWDVGIFDHGAYLPETPLYDRAAAVGLIPGLEWGGNWTRLKDRPHYQLATGFTIDQVRAKFEAGQTFV